MSVRILVGHEAGDDRPGALERACLFDSVTDTCFGPVFWGLDQAESFLAFCDRHFGDPRSLSSFEVSDIADEWHGLTHRSGVFIPALAEHIASADWSREND